MRCGRRTAAQRIQHHRLVPGRVGGGSSSRPAGCRAGRRAPRNAAAPGRRTGQAALPSRVRGPGQVSAISMHGRRGGGLHRASSAPAGEADVLAQAGAEDVGAGRHRRIRRRSSAGFSSRTSWPLMRRGRQRGAGSPQMRSTVVLPSGGAGEQPALAGSTRKGAIERRRAGRVVAHGTSWKVTVTLPALLEHSPSGSGRVEQRGELDRRAMGREAFVIGRRRRARREEARHQHRVKRGVRTGWLPAITRHAIGERGEVARRFSSIAPAPKKATAGRAWCGGAFPRRGGEAAASACAG